MSYIIVICVSVLNPLNPELNPICHLLALLGAHHILHISRIRVKPASPNVRLCDLVDTCLVYYFICFATHVGGHLELL